MPNRSTLILILLFIFCLSGSAMAKQKEHHDPDNSESELHLSHDLRELLTQEMISIQNTMMQMMPLISSGNWHQLAQLAGKIAESHIMKQKLTKAQIEELHDKLPQGFKELDNSFHDLAGMLAHVAQVPHTELVTFYYYKLTETCISCHSKYATHRFPALKPSAMSHSHGQEHEHHPEHH